MHRLTCSFLLGLIMPKREEDDKYKKIGENIFGIIFLIAVGFLLYKGVPAVFKSVTGYFGDKSDAKAFCGKHPSVLNAKTDYAAKKAFKACLKRH